jgi:hypothetical protein
MNLHLEWVWGENDGRDGFPHVHSPFQAQNVIAGRRHALS